ncbi:hypothetical protein HN51_053334 [Arachis hypogaea]|uniref:uncharacterized protein LOC107618447 isoform X2 n=1 Tax=Arachis ipaensis TaxID=130454 RepID=UPI0007AF53AD|nr:uncharacterized protein LOC107618447 isoform X2 [Arachis ipaensis]XP_025676649.1 uncharacterized protein LOC112776640 isoform X2 [Arachis hypogaea]
MLLKCIHMALLSSSSSSVNLLLFSPSLTPSIHPLSTIVLLRRRRFSCRAASPGPPPAPRTDPPPGNDSGMLRDLAASLSKIQDRAQIFFAVLFWMSLFFWASAWDGRNRPNK